MSNSAASFLSAGEILTLTYHIKVTDPAGGSDTQVVTVTVLGTNHPAVNTVVVNQLLRPQAMIEIEVVARRSASGRRSAESQPSAARESGGILYLFSILPLGEIGNIASPGDVAGQRWIGSAIGPG